jgi:ribosome-associated protein
MQTSETGNNQNLTQTIIEGIQEKKGHKITVLDLASAGASTTATFIICQGNSTSHVSSVADSIREYVHKNAGRKPYNYDGYRNCEWIVIDYGEVMVHVFLPDVRNRYNLEELWSDAPCEEIEDLD